MLKFVIVESSYPAFSLCIDLFKSKTSNRKSIGVRICWFDKKKFIQQSYLLAVIEFNPTFNVRATIDLSAKHWKCGYLLIGLKDYHLGLEHNYQRNNWCWIRRYGAFWLDLLKGCFCNRKNSVFTFVTAEDMKEIVCQNREFSKYGTLFKELQKFEGVKKKRL